MTVIKICGITSLPDALAAIEAGADYLGFNFYPKSPRYIAPSVCAEIIAVLKREHPRIQHIGVFVNSPVEEITATLAACALDLAQLHGDEPPEMLTALAGRAFKALRLPADNLWRKSLICARKPKARAAPANKPTFLIDASVRGLYGGSGVTADWDAAVQIARRCPIFLAGGLTPENVAAAIQQVHPWGVDVASGVESAPGVKDPAKMKAFVKAVQAASKAA
ncbi:MAG: phosphoribosylanthranilate isomerase [Anaerolineales bacterium]